MPVVLERKVAEYHVGCCANSKLPGRVATLTSAPLTCSATLRSATMEPAAVNQLSALASDESAQ